MLLRVGFREKLGHLFAGIGQGRQRVHLGILAAVQLGAQRDPSLDQPGDALVAARRNGTLP